MPPLMDCEQGPDSGPERVCGVRKALPFVSIFGLGLLIGFIARTPLPLLTSSGTTGQDDQQYQQLVDPGPQSAACTHALGGGVVGRGGGFLHFNPKCAAELKEYFDEESGVYFDEVATVATSAMQYFTDLAQAPTRKQVIVFDIDETVLSNRATFFTTSSTSDTSGRARALAAASTAGVQMRSAAEAFKQPWATDAPALQPMLVLYRYLYSLGYSVAFLTGRSDDARNATSANLLHVGFGKPCAAPAAAGSDGSDEVISQPAAASNWGGVGNAMPSACYVRLLMRQVGDVRLASVYKPGARELLVQAGYEIVGNFGDQFSDLVGIWNAPGSFKLPNPIYYIL